MKRTKYQYQNIILIGLIVILVSSIFAFTKNQNESFDPRNQAAYEMTPWNFTIVGDTQSSTQEFYQSMTNLMIQDNPYMLIHVGDMNYQMNANRQPLKMIVDLRTATEQQHGTPLEYHAAMGNHDDTNYKNWREWYKDLICFGKVPYHEGLGYCEDSLDPSCQMTWQEVGPLNPYVQQAPMYCVSNPTDIILQQYSFVKGNIRFIMLQMPYYSQSQERIDWAIAEACKENEQSATLIFTHNGDFAVQKQFIDSLDSCPNHNVKAIITGHTHIYRQETYKNVEIISVSGSFYGQLDMQSATQNSDYWNAHVQADKIVLSRILWNGSSFNAPEVKLEIPGTFTNFFETGNPDENPDEQTQTMSYSIAKGNQIISFPLKQSELVVSQLYSQMGGKPNSIVSYEGGYWYSYKIVNGTPFATQDFSINQKNGYFIQSKEQFEYQHEGTTDFNKSDCKFNKGWNLVSYRCLVESANLEWNDDLSNNQQLASEIFDGLHENNINIKILSDLDQDRYRSLIYDQNQYYGNDFNTYDPKGYFVLIEN
ncbi:metallophosphoesterase [Candidatus Dojkabacteria bacterium]|nr:metallophosphoesterase [Candidatus Dojkabacteria bacterium]